MRLIFKAIVFLFFLIPVTCLSGDNPPFKLIIHWTIPSDTSHVPSIRQDESICCDFVITLVKSESFYGEILSYEGESLGVLYGKILPSFLKKITPNLLSLKYDLERRKNSSILTEK